MFPHRKAAREQARQLAFALSFRTIQRDTLKDQRDRLALAVADLNQAYAAPYRTSDERHMVVGHALERAVALLQVCTDYDAIQQTTDNTYPVQEN